MKVHDNQLFDEVLVRAKASPRLRMDYDLLTQAEELGWTDGSQRMLNAIEPGSPLPIHRHQKTSETVVCLRGRLVEEYYDEFLRLDGSSQSEAAKPSAKGWCLGIGLLSF